MKCKKQPNLYCIKHAKLVYSTKYALHIRLTIIKIPNFFAISIYVNADSLMNDLPKKSQKHPKDQFFTDLQ